jgi:hypothetical protein
MFVLPARMSRKRASSSKPRAHPEQSLQIAIATYLARVLTAPTFFTAIGHGGGGKLRGAILKGMGMQAGVPDILIINRGKCLWIELKAGKGSLSSEQIAVHQWLVAAGCSVTVCRSIDDVRERLDVWGVPTIEAKLPPAERAVLRAKALAQH